MAKSDAAELQFLNFAFKGTTIPWESNTELYISLHTSSPGESGSQDTAEATYYGYERKAVARSSLGWSVGASGVTNNLLLEWPAAASGPEIISWLGIGTDETGSGTLLYYGNLSQPITVNTGTIIKFLPGDIRVVEK